MKKKKNNKKKGFTLIEILVVVLIIGVLAAIALPGYMRSVERSRATGPMTNLGSIAKAQNRQKLATMHYTDNVANLDISLTDASNGEDATGSTFESEFFTYKVYGDDKAVATAMRKDVSEDKKYELSVNYTTGQIYCRPITNKTCIDLGLEEGQDYGEPQWDDCLFAARPAIKVSCITRENNGVQETMACYDLGDCTFSRANIDDNGYTQYSCSSSDIVDGFCSSYHYMYEYSEEISGDRVNFTTKNCTNISGLDCLEWEIHEGSYPLN